MAAVCGPFVAPLYVLGIARQNWAPALQRVVVTTKRSPDLREELEERSTDLTVDVPTRWTSTTEMLSRALDHQEAITATLMEEMRAPHSSTNLEIDIPDIPWLKAQGLLDALAPGGSI